MVGKNVRKQLSAVVSPWERKSRGGPEISRQISSVVPESSPFSLGLQGFFEEDFAKKLQKNKGFRVKGIGWVDQTTGVRTKGRVKHVAATVFYFVRVGGRCERSRHTCWCSQK